VECECLGGLSSGIAQQTFSRPSLLQLGEQACATMANNANYIQTITRQLVEKYPQTAMDLIISQCSHEEVFKYHHIASNLTGASRSQSISSLDPPFETASSSTEHSTSPRSNQQGFERIRGHEAYPPTPPRSASTASKSSSRPEYIIVPLLVGDVFVEEYVSMRAGTADLSLIRDELVRSRLCAGANVQVIPNSGVVPIQYKGSCLYSEHQVALTWSRTGSDKTRKTTFYIISNQFEIDSDLMYVTISIYSLHLSPLYRQSKMSCRGT
jgi:hypothetical protein